ncbi:MAG: ferredoxin family protein, partial [Acidobacteriota bacterium]|nr:ferredoxin family protein [Acidobacteriota bacterium]
MNRTEGRNLRVVLYEGTGSDPLGDEERFETLSTLLDNGFEVTRPVSGQEVAPADDAPILVLGRLDQQPPVAADQDIHFRNLGERDALEAAREVREATGARKLEAWKPWFPVIDFDRCTNCMQCLTFCLFDVYGVDKQQQITVQNEDNCKTDCPACSRVCPEVA